MTLATTGNIRGKSFKVRVSHILRPTFKSWEYRLNLP